MEVKVSFCVQGHIRQRVIITKKGYTANQLVKDLKSGRVCTTVQEKGTVDIVETGEEVGVVLSIDNNLEYDEFEVVVES